MAKRRILKKEICYATGDLFMETLVCKLYIPGVDQEKSEMLMARILDVQDAFILRAGHPDGKDSKALVKAYYKKLRVDFQAEIDILGQEIEALSKGAGA